MHDIQLLNLFAGKTQDYPEHEPSAIAKSLLSEPRFLTTLGIEGDEQYEKHFHGGVDRALCHYAIIPLSIMTIGTKLTQNYDHSSSHRHLEKISLLAV